MTGLTMLTKMVQCEQSANENNVFKRKCLNTCGYCSKLILDEAARLIQLHGVLRIMCQRDPPKDTVLEQRAK